MLGCAATETGATVGVEYDSDGDVCAAFGLDDCVFKSVPSPETCTAGVLSADWETRALAEVNRIRVHAGLPEVAYDTAAQPGLQACALVNAGAGTTEHDLDPSAPCFSVIADAACQRANLTTLRFGIPASGLTVIHRSLRSPERFVRSWLTDVTDDGELGHRRWLLDPFLGPTAFGMAYATSTANDVTDIRQVAALQVMSPTTGDPAAMASDFVATPVGEYPEVWVAPDWYLSFSVLLSRTSVIDNAAVDFTSATVTVTKDGAPAALATANGAPDVRHASGGKGPAYGLPNHLAWRMAEPLQTGSTYAVTIGNVALPGGPKSYQYWFRLTEAAP